jgi:hypothetical protein
MRAGARARRGESVRDGMYTMQCARKDEVFVGGELRETIWGLKTLEKLVENFFKSGIK